MADISLTLLVLKTRQVEQLRAFYQTLGIELAEEQHGKGPLRYAGQAGDVVIEVYPLPDDTSQVDSSTGFCGRVRRRDLTLVIHPLSGSTRNMQPPTTTGAISYFEKARQSCIEYEGRQRDGFF